MSVDAFIADAIDRGAKHGLSSLAPLAQVVFAVTEAEVYCDMEGIDSLFEKYGYSSSALFADAFRAIGASKVGAAFFDVAQSDPPISELLLDELNDLVRERCGYGYENISSYVQKHV